MYRKPFKFIVSGEKNEKKWLFLCLIECQLMKTPFIHAHTASEIVELTVQRGQKMQRPTSITSGVSPSTPLAQRGSITAPLPVDVSKVEWRLNQNEGSNLRSSYLLAAR